MDQRTVMFKLSQGPGSLGLNCKAGGLMLAGVPLLHKVRTGFVPRPRHEVRHLVTSAYGADIDVTAVTRGLGAVARALNEGELGRAMIAAVHLRLPELDWDSAARLAQADDVVSKYDPNEPRDAQGRWTTGGSVGTTVLSSPPQSGSESDAPPTGPTGTPFDPEGAVTCRTSPITAYFMTYSLIALLMICGPEAQPY
jgi:hypothetical protein